MIERPKATQIFQRAAFSAPPRIMGLQLRPYSLGHNYALKALGLPLHWEAQPVDADPEDLAQAVLLCSLRWEEIVPVFIGNRAPDGWRMDYAHRKRPSKLRKLAAFLLPTPGKTALAAEVQAWAEGCDLSNPRLAKIFFCAFRDYVETYCTAPEHTWKKDDPGLLHPWEWIVAARLIDAGIAGSRTEAWEMPVNEARCWFSALGELAGMRTLVSERLDSEGMMGADEINAMIFGKGRSDG